MDKTPRTGIHTDNPDVKSKRSGPVRHIAARGGSPGARSGSDGKRVGTISDNALVRGLERLRGCERKIMVRILHYLGEVDRRRIYLPRGYCSLFEFCTGHLKYSRSAAGRRIAAARTLREFPALETDLLSGRITLYSMALVSRILTADNFAQIVPGIRNRSSRDVEALVSGYRPKEMFRDRIRPVSVLLPVPAHGGMRISSMRSIPCGDGVHCGNGSPCEDNAHCGDGLHCGNGTPCGDRAHCGDGLHCGESNSPAGKGSGAAAVVQSGSITPGAGSGMDREANKIEGVKTLHADDSGSHPGFRGDRFPAGGRMKVLRKYRLEFAADPRFIEKLEKTKALLSTKFPTGIGLEELFELLMDEYIDRHSPEARAGRRKDRLAKRIRGKDTAAGGSPGADIQEKVSCAPGAVPRAPGAVPRAPSSTARPTRDRRDRPRTVPRRIRDEVYLRDGGRCTYRGPDGRRCGSSHSLQIDHIIPRALGGDNSLENLRLLCGKHNRLEAERVLGHPLPHRPGDRGDVNKGDRDRSNGDRDNGNRGDGDRGNGDRGDGDRNDGKE